MKFSGRLRTVDLTGNSAVSADVLNRITRVHNVAQPHENVAGSESVCDTQVDGDCVGNGGHGGRGGDDNDGGRGSIGDDGEGEIRGTIHDHDDVMLAGRLYATTGRNGPADIKAAAYEHEDGTRPERGKLDNVRAARNDFGDVTVEHVTILMSDGASIEADVHTPSRAAVAVVIHAHGGAFAFGDCRSEPVVYDMLARQSGLIVVVSSFRQVSNTTPTLLVCCLIAS